MLSRVLIVTLVFTHVLCDDDQEDSIHFPGYEGPPPHCPRCPPNSVCRQVSTSCDNFNCQKFLSCVDRNSRSCERFSCQDGSQCVNIVNPCLVAPCPSFPRCVLASNSARRPCNSERDCRSLESCIKTVDESCNSGDCPGRSFCVVTQGNDQEITCRNARCARDTPICINVLPAQCSRPPCRISPKCIRPTDVCALPKEVGPCEALISRWYYNQQTRMCERFAYGGCQGNANNFQTQSQCASTCGGNINSARRPCNSDRDCGSPESCMKLVDESCNSGDCPGRSYCVVTQGSNQEITCRNVRCSLDSPICINILPTRCTRPPCKITPKCIKPTERRSCRSDGDCFPVESCIKVVDESCNSLNCPGSSVCVVTRGNNQELTCRNALCSPGSLGCVNVLPKSCRSPPCIINPKCLSGGRTPCQTDAQCSRNEHCTDLVSAQCGQPSCPKQSFCVSNDEPTCERVPCPSGTVDCVTIETNCPIPPCPVSARCISENEPLCGDAICKNDEFCADVQSCSQPSCQQFRACVSRQAPSCAATLCFQNSRCVLIKNPCNRGLCPPPRTECIPNSSGGNGKGVCPRLPHSTPGRQCNNDFICSGNEKCCQLAGQATKTCTPAVTGKTKPGRCPPSNGLPGICVFNPDINCIRDGECPLDLKCCNSGCNSVCTTPINA